MIILPIVTHLYVTLWEGWEIENVLFELGSERVSGLVSAYDISCSLVSMEPYYSTLHENMSIIYA